MDTTPLFEFSERAELRQWLEENHGTTPFCWVATTRGKEPRHGAIPYLEVVEECLCFGWIDSTVKRLDEGRQAQRISPRRKGSNWTLLNIRRFTDLEKRGLVTEAGRKAFREAGRFRFLITESAPFKTASDMNGNTTGDIFLETPRLRFRPWS